jgi:hypothetical protein
MTLRRQEGAILSLGDLRVHGSALVPQGGEEQRLVNPTLEDRHAHLHALGNYLSPVHSSFAREFGGGQMDRHSQSSLRSLAALKEFLPGAVDGANLFPAICDF